jgi:hypothetical protein
MSRHSKNNNNPPILLVLNITQIILMGAIENNNAAIRPVFESLKITFPKE